MSGTKDTGGYDPHAVEPGIYAFWERGEGEHSYFHARPDPRRRPYTIVIPPPNVTGALHLGHALNNTLQDILIRLHRMRGYVTCWLPGTDHAGIATQAVVEKRLREEQGWRRDPGSPEHRAFLVGKINEWKDEYRARILAQLKRMGCSCDWQRERFTLDEQCASAVYETFFRFFKDGLIYRGLRLVNWDTQLQTAVADDEVYHETVKGNLWHIRYPIEGTDAANARRDGDVALAQGMQEHRPLAGATQPTDDTQSTGDTRFLVVATTRPETMLADTAVAVHPDDERYRHLHDGHGAAPTHFVLLPLMNRRIPIIADGMLVKKEFGTGCVKVTPGHDPNDYACWQRHQGQPDEFGIIDLLTPDGRINENGRALQAKSNAGGPASSGGIPSGDIPGGGSSGRISSGGIPSGGPASGRSLEPTGFAGFDYVGMKKEDARKKVVADLETLGLLERVEPYETDVGHSDRSKTPIEPLRSEQWFVRMEPTVEEQQRAARQGRKLPRLAELAMEAVRDGRVRFFPERYAKTYLDWLGEKRDWCISRQLWWGHRIPIWRQRFRGDADELRADFVLKGVDHALEGIAGVAARVVHRGTGEMIALSVGVGEGVAIGGGYSAVRIEWAGWEQLDGGSNEVDVFLCIQNEHYKTYFEDAGFEQDPDVLDTWFSSALWPHSTFGWPQDRGQDARATQDFPTAASEQQDLEYFYPTSVLSTAREIITLWVARMVMTGLYNLGRVPFSHVYIHPVMQDGQGRPMKKSLGNGVDPLDIIEMYGADALRFTLAALVTETQDVRIPVQRATLPDGRTVNTSEKFELGRNFCNKLWQVATGFILPNVKGLDVAAHRRGGGPASGRSFEPASKHQARDWSGTGPLSHGGGENHKLDLFDRWIGSRLQSCIREVSTRLDRYEFSAAAEALRAFVWSEFCDWYVEEAKTRLAGERGDEVRATMLLVLDVSLCLLHPFVPFITEELWRRVGEIVPGHYRLIWPDLAAQRAGHRPDGPRDDVSHVLRERWGASPPDAAPALIVMPWPQVRAEALDNDAEQAVGATLQPAIRALREIRTSLNAVRAQSKQPVLKSLPRALIRTDARRAALLGANEGLIRRLGRCDALSAGPDLARPAGALSKVLPGIEVYVPAAELADLSLERQRLSKERTDLGAHAERLRAKLADESFVGKAPAAVVERERARLAELDSRLATIDRNLSDLTG
jgi:valyl-tRNA synthetase